MLSTLFTENTEVLTEEGWRLVETIQLGDYVLGVKKKYGIDYIVKTKVTGLGEAEYKGVVRVYNKGLYVCAKKIILPEFNQFRKNVEIGEPVLHKYEGLLYSITTETNTLITRSFMNYNQHYNDYIISLCHVD